MTTNANGTIASQMRFTPFGEELTWEGSGASKTDFGFTGQRNESGFGLMDYNARFYAPSLGRFISADAIIPSPGNPMAWDRFGYVQNNPLSLIDPSGHLVCGSNSNIAEGDCSTPTENYWANFPTVDDLIAEFGVTLTGDFTEADKIAILEGLTVIGDAIANITGQTNSYLAFQKVFGQLTFSMSDGKKDGSWSCSGSGSGFSCDPDAGGKIDARLVAHELGHTLNAIIANNDEATPYDDLWDASIRDNDGLWVTGIQDNGAWVRGYSGYISEGAPDLYHGPNDWDDAATGTRNEEFADMFMNWAFDSFDYRPEANGAGTARYNWMTTNMSEWINRAGK